MLINKAFHDVPSALDSGGRPVRIYVISPVVPHYPHARFPGTSGSGSDIVGAETKVALRRSMLQVCVTGAFLNGNPSHSALFSEIYQVTGPVERFAGQIASQGYVVGQQSKSSH